MNKLESGLRALGAKTFTTPRETAKGTYISTNCPLAAIPGRHKSNFDNNPSLAVNVQSPFITRCFSCGFKGTIHSLAKQLLEHGVVGHGIYAQLPDKENIRQFKPISLLRNRYKPPVDKTDEYFAMSSELTDAQYVWLEGKGCNEATARSAQLRSGPYGVICFPVQTYDTNRNIITVGVWARQPFPRTEQRSKYWALIKFAAEQFVYGITTWAQHKNMVIFEGMLDVLHARSLGLDKEYNFAAIQRSSISSVFHIGSILNTSPPTVIIVGDPDSPGWLGAAKSLAVLELRHRDVRTVVSTKDPKQLTKAELSLLIQQAPTRTQAHAASVSNTSAENLLRLYKEKHE